MPSRRAVKPLVYPLRLCAFALIHLLLFLASCAPAPPSVLPPSPTGRGDGGEGDSLPVPYVSEIRFALIGKPADVNAWALFDRTGASYANYAVRWEYWPRLYTLSIPDRQFTPMAAKGMPLPVTRDGDFYVGAVKLRTDLSWTNGAPFTAEDVAFTVNTALDFQLGFDWRSYYNFDFLDHVQAQDSSTVKFYFKKRPNVGLWQYGALQGPILQKTYWQPRVAKAAALLPEDAMRSAIAETETRRAALQKEVGELEARLSALKQSGEQGHQLEGELRRKQGDLDGVNYDLIELNDELTVKIDVARQALYALDSVDEPTLGSWMPAGGEGGVWVNDVNPNFPFGQPHYNHSAYRFFENIGTALTAFENNEVDVILNQYGIPNQNWAKTDPTQHVRFLVFNPREAILADPYLRKAMACFINQSAMSSGQAEPLYGFVTNGPWQSEVTVSNCSGLQREQRIRNAVGILKEGGYSWTREPTSEQPGVGLTLPAGTAFPVINLLTTLPEVEFWRFHSSEYIEMEARHLGIPLKYQVTSLESLNYAVYSSGDYDMVILAWRLSEYPGYLCEWFKQGGPFDYGSAVLQFRCEALENETDLEAAMGHIRALQSILAEDLPFIPLYAVLNYDAFQHVTYPFDSVTGGLSGVYGAPSLAIPSP